MRIETYRRKSQEFYSQLQSFLDEVGQEAGAEVPSVYELMSLETAQIERLTVLATRKMKFEDQFNFQAVEAPVPHNQPVTIGAKGIRGQPRDVQWRTSTYFNPKRWDWRPKGEQTFEVHVTWDADPGELVTVTFDVWGD